MKVMTMLQGKTKAVDPYESCFEGNERCHLE